MSVILFIIILLVLVLVHEFGHFITAKKLGMRVDEFGFGFPPRAVKLFKKGETLYSLNWLPLGGFVKIFGENPDEESVDGPDKARSFVNKPKWAQAIVLVAGIVMNILLAWVLISFGFASGMPVSSSSAPKNSVIHDSTLVVIEVAPKSPAQMAGLMPGDKILGVVDTTSHDSKDMLLTPGVQVFQDYIKTKNDKLLDIQVLRKDTFQNISVTPKTSDGAKVPTIGISMDMIGTVRLSLPRALWEGAKMTVYMLKSTAVGLAKLVSTAIIGKADLSAVSGPVGIAGIVGDAYKFGIGYLFSFAALISINLAIINLIPFPALDGGRLLFLLIEKIKGSRIKPAIANTINAVGFFLLIGLMLVVTYHDILKLIK